MSEFNVDRLRLHAHDEQEEDDGLIEDAADEIERLREIVGNLPDRIAEYFNLADTDFYHLTRVKEAFALGTMLLDDFVEVDEETVNDMVAYLRQDFPYAKAASAANP